MDRFDFVVFDPNHSNPVAVSRNVLHLYTKKDYNATIDAGGVMEIPLGLALVPKKGTCVHLGGEFVRGLIVNQQVRTHRDKNEIVLLVENTTDEAIEIRSCTKIVTAQFF